MIDIQNQSTSTPTKLATPVPLATANKNLKLPNPICKKCQSVVGDNFYFCPNCGKKLKEPPFKFSLSNTVGNTLVSILLPPLGFLPGIKHLLMHDQKAKILGLLYITLTIIATVITIKIMVDYFNNLNKMLNDIYLLG